MLTEAYCTAVSDMTSADSRDLLIHYPIIKINIELSYDVFLRKQ